MYYSGFWITFGEIPFIKTFLKTLAQQSKALTLLSEDQWFEYQIMLACHHQPGLEGAQLASLSLGG